MNQTVQGSNATLLRGTSTLENRREFGHAQAQKCANPTLTKRKRLQIRIKQKYTLSKLPTAFVTSSKVCPMALRMSSPAVLLREIFPVGFSAYLLSIESLPYGTSDVKPCNFAERLSLWVPLPVCLSVEAVELSAIRSTSGT